MYIICTVHVWALNRHVTRGWYILHGHVNIFRKETFGGIFLYWMEFKHGYAIHEYEFGISRVWHVQLNKAINDPHAVSPKDKYLNLKWHHPLVPGLSEQIEYFLYLLSKIKFTQGLNSFRFVSKNDIWYMNIIFIHNISLQGRTCPSKYWNRDWDYFCTSQKKLTQHWYAHCTIMFWQWVQWVNARCQK